MRVISKGIGPNDWVIVNGIQRARPGSAVTPQKLNASAFTPATQPILTTQASK
jgi:hypothetical protein